MFQGESRIERRGNHGIYSVPSDVASHEEHHGSHQRTWGSREANQSQPEEVFVPFNLPPVKPELTEEAKPPVAVPASSSEAMPVGV